MKKALRWLRILPMFHQVKFNLKESEHYEMKNMISMLIIVHHVSFYQAIFCKYAVDTQQTNRTFKLSWM